MADIIRGKVINIVDGDTFDITVTYASKDNKYSYVDDERVCIEDIDEPELKTIDRKRSKYNLEKKLNVISNPVTLMVV